MAAEVLSAAGVPVHLFDAMPSVGRKFLLAGIGGLNLTHAEPLPAFVQRYGPHSPTCARWLQALSPQGVRDWAAGLGIDTFVGSSQRVFPTDMKAAPLLRAWLHRLRHPASGAPVTFHMRHRWNGTLAPLPAAAETDGPAGWQVAFDTPHGPQAVQAQAVLLALGGGSWPRLGSDAAWLPWLTERGVALQPLKPANCGFEVAVHGRRGWSDYLSSRFAGQPLKGVVLSVTDSLGQRFERKGECVVTAHGIEGSLVYAASALLRDDIDRAGQVHLTL
ncbi:MAG TPA: TIGR03862 family flavoprotein, partial [Macromonas sp.]|nr:TIGR03862 family flavoprotein [Macromonas sp.]